MGIFLGANFIFIPALTLAVVALNARTARIRLQLAEVALLGVALSLFLFLNLAPNYGGLWVMRGTWISRLYQPVFPTLVFLVARWWQALPRLDRLTGIAVSAALAFTCVGDGLVVFGPILNNPGEVSAQAFYRFYDATSRRYVYAANLANLGRRPIGFPRVSPAPLHSAALVTSEQQALADEHQVRASLLRSLIGNRLAYLEAARALAANRLALAQAQLDLAKAKGTTAEPPQELSAYLPSGARALINDPRLTSATGGIVFDPVSPVPSNYLAIKRAKARVVEENQAVVEAVDQAQKDLTATQAQLSQTMAELTQVEQTLAKAQQH
jgi:hypothetical protein